MMFESLKEKIEYEFNRFTNGKLCESRRSIFTASSEIEVKKMIRARLVQGYGTDTEAKLMIVGRDQEDQELTLEFNRERCIWMLAYAEKEPLQKPIEPIVRKIAEFMKGQTQWSGTASELLELLPDPDMKANILTRKLNVNVSVLYNEFGILVARERSSFRREITLTRMDPEERMSADENGDTGRSFMTARRI